MCPATVYSANNILDREFGNSAYTPPSSFFLGLSVNTPSYSGSNFLEPSDPQYSRVNVVNNKTSFSVSASGLISNNLTISFPQSGSSWGVISTLGFFDASASTTNHLRAWISLAQSITVSASSIVTFQPGTITLNLV